MPKTSNKKLTALFWTAIALSALLGVFRTYLLINDVEPDTGFYVTGSTAGIYFNIAAAVLCLFILACSFAARGVKMSGELKSESTAVVFSSSLCGFLFLTVLIYGAYRAFLGNSADAFMWIEMLLCIPCMLNFFAVSAKELRNKSAVQTVLALFPAVFFAVRTVDLFTDVKTQINVSQRSLTLAMLCAMMIFFVCEAGFLIPQDEQDEKEQQVNAAKYFGAGLFTVILAITTVIPYLAVCAFWVYESDFLIMDVLDASVCLYAATRIISLAKAKAQ